MAVIALASASGSPGVTTCALGLAMTWPRPVVLVDADPTGGSGILAGYLQGAVQPVGGLLDVVMGMRTGPVQVRPEHLMPLSGDRVRLLAGIRSHAQAKSLPALWEPLLGALRQLGRTGQDVIVDCGRLGLTGSPEPLLRGADAPILVTHSSLSGLAAARSWVESLRVEAPALGAAVVDAGRPYSNREITKWLRIPVLADVQWDPLAAAVFSDGGVRPRRFDSSGLLRSLRACGDVIRARMAAVEELDEVEGTAS